MAGGRFELAMEPTAVGRVLLNSNSETHMTAICDARLIYRRGISRVFICCAALRSCRVCLDWSCKAKLTIALSTTVCVCFRSQAYKNTRQNDECLSMTLEFTPLFGIDLDIRNIFSRAQRTLPPLLPTT